MSEFADATIIANKVLDRPWADPDDDLGILSRQLLRMRERLKLAEAVVEAADAYLLSAEVDQIPLENAILDYRAATQEKP